MAAQVPKSFHVRLSSSKKPLNLYQGRLILRVVLSMSAFCLLELELPFAQAQPDQGLSTTGQEHKASAENSPSTVQEPDSTIPELELIKEEENVSIAIGLGREQPISQAPSNVYVITDEDIRHSGATDIPTILRRIPGLEVMQVTGADFNVSVRGDNQLPANKLLVLIDGRSIYEDAYGSVFWTTLPITLPEIKRIEVLKGPASALYGFNAFDGVINIITKSPEEIKGTTLQFGGGELGTIRAAAIQAGTYGKLGYRLSVGHDQNNQWRERDKLALRQSKINLHTEYALSSAAKLTVQGGFLGNNSYDGQVYAFLHETTSNIRSWYTYVSYDRPNFFIRGWWNEWTHGANESVNPLISRFLRAADKTGNSDQNRIRNTYNLEAQHAIDLGKANRFTYGANLRTTSFTSGFLTDGSAREDRVGLYIQDELRVTSQLTAVAGLRYDLHTQINPTYSPRVALIYAPLPDHTFRASWSIAYRPPTIFETFIDSQGTIFPLGCPPACNVAIARRGLLGSKDSEPEQIMSYEVGYQGWYFKHRVRVRADLFFNHIQDLIPFEAPSTINRGSADIYGGEAGLEFLATSWLTGFANYSYQEIGQNATLTARRAAPRFKTNAGLRGEWTNGLNGEAAVHYVSAVTYPINSAFLTFSTFPGGQPPPEQRVGSYVLLNVRAGYLFWHEKAEVSLTAFNALNDKHKEHPLGEVIGSRVMGWLTLRF